MDVTNTQQNINVNATSASKSTASNQKSSDTKFADELKNVEKEKEKETEKDKKTEADKAAKDEKVKKEKEAKEKQKKDNSVDEAIDGLQDTVNKLNKLGQKDEKEENSVKQDEDFVDKRFIILNEDNALIDNNMNIQDPNDKFSAQAEANMNFNSSEQPFSQFVNQDKENNLKSSAKELEEEKAILSTMEENIAIANRNMLMKNKTVQDETGIKKVDTKSHLVVDTIVSYSNVVMDKADVDFFVNLVENGVVNLNEVQNAEKSSRVSKTLADLLAKAMNDNKPIRIDFDNNISVIIKIDRAGKISADFLPSSQVAEAYLKENLPLLRQRFDDNNIDYNELNQRRQKQDSQDNRKKDRKDE